MQIEKQGTKKCKDCKSEIPKDAKVCPYCRRIQSNVVALVFICVLIGVAIPLLAINLANYFVSDTEAEKSIVGETIIYEACTVGDMVDLLGNNALRAEKEYQDKYVEVSGRLGNIDSDGKYITLYATDSTFAITGVQCYLQSDEQLNKVIEMSIDDIITVKGKIISVGEILGYSLETHEIN